MSCDPVSGVIDLLSDSAQVQTLFGVSTKAEATNRINEEITRFAETADPNAMNDPEGVFLAPRIIVGAPRQTRSGSRLVPVDGGTVEVLVIDRIDSHSGKLNDFYTTCSTIVKECWNKALDGAGRLIIGPGGISILSVDEDTIEEEEALDRIFVARIMFNWGIA